MAATLSEVIHKPGGFTLLELAIVLLVVSLFLGFGLSSVTALRTNLGISSTRGKQHALKDALITFISRNQRLPCPAVETLAPGVVDYGVESGGGLVACGAAPIGGGAIQRGVVPWVSLGLSDADALDGWYNRFSYFVVETATANPTPAAPLSGMRGGIALHSGIPALGLPPTGNQINACSTTAGDNTCNIAAAALILSYGNNGSGAFTSDGTPLDPPIATAEFELANTDTADVSFVQTNYSTDEANPFDDILLAMAPADLLGPLERNNSIPSARAVTNDQITRLKDTLIATIVNGYALGPPPSAPVPAAPPVPAPPDGWGTALVYARVITDVCGTPLGSIAFRITSRNIDLLADPDDIVFEQSADSLKTRIVDATRPCP